MVQNPKTKKGFTIIEVALVLAIAGLIFLMVFVALPAVRSSQRDGQRRQDMSRVVTALVQYQTNNRTKRNNLPGPGKADFSAITDEGFCSGTTACTFIKNYMNASGASTNVFTDPDGVPYNMLITDNMVTAKETDFASSLTFNDNSKLSGDSTNGYTIDGTDAFNQHVVYIVPGGLCSGESVVKASGLRQFAVLYKLEGAGTYCVGSDNQ